MNTPTTPTWSNASHLFQMLSMFGFVVTTKKLPSADMKNAMKAKILYALLCFLNFNFHLKIFFLLKLASAFYNNEENCQNELYVSFVG